MPRARHIAGLVLVLAAVGCMAFAAGWQERGSGGFYTWGGGSIVLGTVAWIMLGRPPADH